MKLPSIWTKKKMSKIEKFIQDWKKIHFLLKVFYDDVPKKLFNIIFYTMFLYQIQPILISFKIIQGPLKPVD